MQQSHRKFLQKFSQLEQPFTPTANGLDQTQFCTLLLPAGIYDLNMSKFQVNLTKAITSQTANTVKVGVVQRSDCLPFIRQATVKTDGRIQMVVQDLGALSYLYYAKEMDENWQYKNLGQAGRGVADNSTLIQDIRHPLERHFISCSAQVTQAGNATVNVVYPLKHLLSFMFDKGDSILRVKQQLEIKLQIQASQCCSTLNLTTGVLLGQGQGPQDAILNDESAISCQLVMYQIQVDPQSYQESQQFYKYIYQTKSKSNQLTQIVYSPQSLVHQIAIQYFTDVSLVKTVAANVAYDSFSSSATFPSVHAQTDANYMFNAQPQTIQLNSVQVLNKEATETERVFVEQIQALEEGLVKKHNSTGALISGAWTDQIQINANMGTASANVNQCYTFIDLIPMQ